jgi:deoxyribodipyrimidine photo-lyase
MTKTTFTYACGLVWLRRDLRCHDHAALSEALASCKKVFIAFVFDKTILDELSNKADRRVEFIWQSVVELNETLKKHGGALICEHAHAIDAIPKIADKVGAQAVFTNHDYEPAAVHRDEAVAIHLKALNIEFKSFKDQVIFEKSEVLTGAQKPFSVFTPYKNAWLKLRTDKDLAAYPCDLAGGQLSTLAGMEIPSLEAMGFKSTNLNALKIAGGSRSGLALLKDFADRIGQYDESRNFPSVKGPSYLSVHFRFGTVSIREAARLAWHTLQTKPAASAGAQTWLSELIWRDFYFQILHHNPRVVKNAYKPEYDLIQWNRDSEVFDAWKQGRTGYPLVDAAMAQLNQTGYMHNRLRMVVASFLIKDLGIDWRWGEAYFAEQLNDFDLSANNGGWQWAASSGCDAQPYFRIFNPITQSEKFDAEGKFIKRYLPQLAGLTKKTIHAPWLAGPIELQATQIKLGETYAHPIVAHDVARAETLERYSVVKKTTADD